MHVAFLAGQAARVLRDGEARLDRAGGDREDAARKDEPPQRRRTRRSVSLASKLVP